MYAEYFGLREPPFNITPDPRFLYLNDCYQEALAALGYGIEARKGFISLIGDAGTGKTTLLRRLLDTVGPATKTVLLLNPTVSFDEILEHTLLELGVPPEGGRKLVLLQRLNEFLLEHTQAGGNVALLIDEAQDLRPDVLEELRLLSNLETAREKILQIVLAGQPELDATLADPSLRQLRQRVALRIRLRPLSQPEVAAYVRARVERVGGTAAELFPPDALASIAMLSHGIPRLVNVLCDAALLGTFAAGKRAVTSAIVEDTWRDYDTGAPAPVMPYRPSTPPPAPAATVARPAPVAEPPVPTPAPFVEAPAAAAEPAADPRPPAPPAPPPLASEVMEFAPAARIGRKPLSVPLAAAVVMAMAVALYPLSIRQHGLPAAPPQTASVPAPAETAAVPESPPPAAMAALDPDDAAASEGKPAAQPAVADGPLSAAEAAALVEAFRAAYEARDVDRLVELFSDDADENGVRGLDAIAANYRATLPTLSQVRYSMPSLAVKGDGPRAAVLAPFFISYRNGEGVSGEVRGQAEWALERRDGRPRIVALSYRLDPTS